MLVFASFYAPFALQDFGILRNRQLKNLILRKQNDNKWDC